MIGTISWIPSPSTGIVAQDLMVYINGGGGSMSGILPMTSTFTIDSFNTRDTYDIYVVTYRVGGLQRAVSAHLTGVVPEAQSPIDPLLPATGLSIIFT